MGTMVTSRFTLKNAIDFFKLKEDGTRWKFRFAIKNKESKKKKKKNLDFSKFHLNQMNSLLCRHLPLCSHIFISQRYSY